MARGGQKKRCTARRKSDGTQCRNWAINGLNVCRMHGGASKKAKAAAKRNVELRKAQALAEKAVATLGLAKDVLPTQALLDEVRWTAGHVEWLRERVQELEPHPPEHLTEDGVELVPDPHPLIHGVSRQELEPKPTIRIDDEGKKTITYEGETFVAKTIETAAPSVWYVLYMQERQHLVRVCEAAIKAGVEERRVELEKQQGLIVAGLLREVLEALWARVIEQADGAPARAVWDAAVGQIVPAALRARAH